MRNHFCKSWSKTYLTNLQIRIKWNTGQATKLKIGELIIVHEENHPPFQWIMGRIAIKKSKLKNLT